MIQLKQGTITADKECWTLTMKIPIDRANKSEKQLEKIKNEFTVYQTYYGSLEGAINTYCDTCLKGVEPEVQPLVEALNGLREEIRSMDLRGFTRYQND